MKWPEAVDTFWPAVVFMLCLFVGMLAGRAVNRQPAAAPQVVPAGIPGVIVDTSSRRLTVEADAPVDLEICLAGDCRLVRGWVAK